MRPSYTIPIVFFVLFGTLASCGQKGLNNENSDIQLNMQNTIKETAEQDTITLAGGCFWCTEAIFQRLKGVVSVKSGYSGGEAKNPTYDEVCTGLTGHAEAIQITFNTKEISLAEILKVFFKTHDPTTLNRQGNDSGTQYRSAIFYRNEEQRKMAEEIKEGLDKSGAYNSPIVTEISPLTVFYAAENYHQNYYNQNKNSNPYCQYVIVPKLEKFEHYFSDKIKY